MAKTFDNEQVEAVLAVVRMAQEIVSTGEVPEATNGWTVLTPGEAGFFNSTQNEVSVPVAHSDPSVVHAARSALVSMGFMPDFTPSLDTRRFVLIDRRGIKS